MIYFRSSPLSNSHNKLKNDIVSLVKQFADDTLNILHCSQSQKLHKANELNSDLLKNILMGI